MERQCVNILHIYSTYFSAKSLRMPWRAACHLHIVSICIESVYIRYAYIDGTPLTSSMKMVTFSG
jgi:hypothetical protein